MNKAKRSMINSVSSVLGYAIPMLINIFTTPILLELLGKDAYGINSLVGVIIGYFTVMDMGLGFPVIKYLSEYKSLGKDYLIAKLLNTTITMYLYIGLIGLIIIMALSKVFALHIFAIPVAMHKDAIYVFFIASFGFLASVGMSWGRAIFHGLQRYDITSGLSIFNQLAGILFGIVAVLKGYGIVGYVGVRVSITVITGILYFIVMKKFIAFTVKPRIDKEIVAKIKNYLGYGIINRVVGSLLGRADVTIIGITISVALVGIYSIPLMLVRSLGYMIAFSVGFVFPAMSELMAVDNISKAGKMFTHVNRIMMIMIGLIFVPLYIWGDSFLELWVNDIASEAIPILKILIVYSIISSSTNTMTNNILLGSGKIKYFTIFNIFKGFFSSVCIYYFITKFGIIGAPIGLVLGELFGIPYMMYCIKYVLRLPLLTTMIHSFFPLLIISLIGFIFNYYQLQTNSWISLIFVVGTFVVTIGIISWLFLLNKEIKALIRDAVRSR